MYVIMTSMQSMIELNLTYMKSRTCLCARLGEFESHGQGPPSDDAGEWPPRSCTCLRYYNTPGSYGNDDIP
jgi:hypothetical protein